MHVLFATAEMEPLVSTGGLGAASRGLVAALRRAGVQVTPVLPGYSAWELADERMISLDVPGWAGPASARLGVHATAGEVAIVDSPSLPRPQPYVDPATGAGWRDNYHRFFAWSAGVAALAGALSPDVVHLNDWHAATVLAHLGADVPAVLTVHNLAHQGWCDPGWLDVLGPRADRFRWKNSVNALAGGIALADRVVAVSPNYAAEITTEGHGMGLDDLLRSRGDALVGILNGIDVDEWDPGAVDRGVARDAVLEEMGLDDGPGPLVVSVSRFDHQKGIDLIADAADVLVRIPVRLALLGAGDRDTEARMAHLAAAHPGRLAFRQGYDAGLARRMFSAGDMTIIPSRFEPCGLTQMQAMRLGTLPVVSDVGGLHDTVVDADDHPRSANGIVMREVSPAGIVDGVHRAVRLLSRRERAERVRQRGMAADWSWERPADEYRRMYEELQ